MWPFAYWAVGALEQSGRGAAVERADVHRSQAGPAGRAGVEEVPPVWQEERTEVDALPRLAAQLRHDDARAASRGHAHQHRADL